MTCKCGKESAYEELCEECHELKTIREARDGGVSPLCQLHTFRHEGRVLRWRSNKPSANHKG